MASARDQWLGIELRHFAALDAIAQERSFRGAASRLGYVQSAISRQVAFLEQLTGARLIDRSQGPRPVCLTEAGEVLRRHAHDILASIEAAKSDFERLSTGGAPEVRVGLFPGVPARILTRAMTSFVARRPEVVVGATEAATDGPLFDLLRDGGIDLAFTTLTREHDDAFETLELLRVPWALVVPATSPLVRRAAPPSVAELARIPLVIPGHGRLEQFLERHWREAGVRARIVCRTEVPATAQSLVAAGLGAALIPQLAVDEHEPRTAAVALEEALPPLSVGLAWHGRRLSEESADFRDALRQASDALQGRHNGRFVRIRDGGELSTSGRV